MEQPQDTIVCPICQHKNLLGAKRCAQCGVSLTGNTTTMRVSDEKVEQVLGDLSYAPPEHRVAIAEGLVFYIAGEVQPLTIRGRDEIVLGRHVDEGQPPADVLDLSSYHGHLLGVSRRHARVKVEGEECLLEDLNSTNGTWLNEKRLTPNAPYILNNGDQVRLGQLILFVYFSSTSSRQKVMLKPSLTATAVLPAPENMTLQLTEQVAVYLRGLDGLQAAIDSIQLREEPHRTMTALTVDGDAGAVEVTLSGYEDAVSVVQQVIVPWQKQFSSLLTALWSGDEMDQALSDLMTLPSVETDAASSQADVATMLDNDVKLETSDLASSRSVQEAAAEAEIVLDAAEAGVEPGPADDVSAPAEETVSGEEAAPVSEDVPSPLIGKIDETIESDLGLSVDQIKQNLLAVVLNHVKSGLAAANVTDEVHYALLREHVDALSQSPLELVKSSI